MKTKECPSCAMQVDAKSKICPVCQYEFPGSGLRLRWIAFLLVVLFMLYMLFT